MAGQEFRIQRKTTTKLLLLWKCSALLLSSQITSALTRTGFVSSFSRHSLLLSTLPGTLLSFMISVAAAIASKADVPGQEQPALVWDMMFKPVPPGCPRTASPLMAQMYPFYLFMVKRGRSFKLKNERCTCVNDHVYLWPAVMAILDK